MKLSLLIDNMVSYMKNLKQATKILSVPINKFSKGTGFGSIYKSQVHFYTVAMNTTK